MSKRRNISGGPLDVPLLDRVVEAGEVAEVPDFQPAHNPKSQPGDPDYLAIEWPPDKWEEVPEPKAAPEPKPAPEPRRVTRAAVPKPAPDVKVQPPAPVPAPAAPAPSSDPRERR